MIEDDFSFELDDTGDNQRRTYRVRAPGLEVWIPKAELAVGVGDVSASGISLLEVPEKALDWGEVFGCDLLLNKKLYISGLFAKVRRILEDGVVGCTFEELDPRKEAKLDKLVLEVQKRRIALKRAREDEA